ncbi:MAG: arsenical pump-driving ATPase GET3 [Thaumarchaeota archaeon]|nr:arsenical pump-driving ATPase GET3 [Candidatus Calditenuaceae archaeon]MDW8043590.1 TRC40/GET3/ArsA family transport-energizing ATPase [Nitrososphaerota archaeon]
MAWGLRDVVLRDGGPRMVIFAGKGGLGKTTSSAALAYAAALSGKRVLCFSTDPQASLSDIFERDIFGKGEVEVARNLYVVEIDADAKISAYIAEVKQRIRDMYKLEEIPAEIEAYIDSSVAEPAMYESATYDAMADYLARGDYDLYVFDMPPFGHGIRMLTMADVLTSWVEKLTEVREKAREYDEIASRLKGERLIKEDEILNELKAIKDKLTTFTDFMRDKTKSAFFMVMTPEMMSVHDTERALQAFRSIGLTLSGIVLNKVLPKELGSNPSPYISYRYKQQEAVLKVIEEKFGDLVVAAIPMFPREPKGLEGLKEVAKHLVDGVTRVW